jgi:transcriptional regulator with XRE-family HTH domain
MKATSKVKPGKVEPRKAATGKGDNPASTPAGVANLGARVRVLRRDRGWNLSDLSDRSSIALSTLSKVENGLLSLTYDRLQQVAEAFDLTLSEFLSPTPTEEGRGVPSARISWAKKGSGAQADTDNYLYNYLCEDLRLKAMVPIMSQCRARSMEAFGPMLKHDAEEFIFVVKGRVEVHTEYYGPQILEEGEGVYLDSRMGHAYLNAAEGGESWILSVNYNH